MHPLRASLTEGGSDQSKYDTQEIRLPIGTVAADMWSVDLSIYYLIGEASMNDFP